MFTGAFVQRESPVHRLDARVRVLAALVLSVCAAALTGLSALVLAGVAAAALAALARLPLAPTLRRLLPINGFLALLCLVLPLSTRGPELFRLAGLAFSAPGVTEAAVLTLKANTIVLVITALLTTMEATQLGRALHALRVPARLVTLLLLTGRYIAVLRGEYQRLRLAMRVRCFEPRTNAHTLRTVGYLVGMLLVKGLDRSERVLKAMKCRGYTGSMPIADLPAPGARDLQFAAAVLAVVVLLGWVNRP